jgi:hypothetical protein
MSDKTKNLSKELEMVKEMVMEKKGEKMRLRMVWEGGRV